MRITYWVIVATLVGLGSGNGIQNSQVANLAAENARLKKQLEEWRPKIVGEIYTAAAPVPFGKIRFMNEQGQMELACATIKRNGRASFIMGGEVPISRIYREVAR